MRVIAKLLALYSSSIGTIRAFTLPFSGSLLDTPVYPLKAGYRFIPVGLEVAADISGFLAAGLLMRRSGVGYGEYGDL